MIGIVKKTSHLGDVSHITVSGIDKGQLVEQVEDLNHYGDLPEIRGRFALIAYNVEHFWFLADDNPAPHDFIESLIKEYHLC